MQNPSGGVEGNSQNNPSLKVPRTRSTFPLGYHFFTTSRFGEYKPHYCEDCVKDDDLPIRSSHKVMSYTLKSPLMQNVSLNKDYFLVPMECILPNNWEKFFDNPVRGDDVSIDVGPTVENFWKLAGQAMDALKTAFGTLLADANSTQEACLEAALRFLIIGEYFYSNGSLLADLNCHGAPYFRCFDVNGDRISWDGIFDGFIGAICQNLALNAFTVSVDGYTYTVTVSGGESAYRDSISMRHFLALVRDNPVFSISGYGSNGLKTVLSSSLTQSFGVYSFQYANVPLNLARVWAYQIVCAHYYSNDHIDFIYSADLYRQLIGSYLRRSAAANYYSYAFFQRNGILYEYDYLCAAWCTRMLGYLKNSANDVLSGVGVNTIGYFSALLAFRRSLRYLDYFTGSRTSPLAVAGSGMYNNTSVPVSGGAVSVLDVTRSIQAQRFLNAVNRVRHSFEGYLKGIFGGETPAPDYHNPFWLSHTDDTIYGDETNNTGAAQMSSGIAITTNLKSNGSRYMFTIHADRPAVAIGISYYDINRVYPNSMDRHFLHKDRFDMFNPFTQFVGDQPIYLQELGISPTASALSTMSNFSYTLRNMEYKQRYSYMSGGFVERLPGWCFPAIDKRGDQSSLNPDWIRSVCAEFDQFYVSLTGWSNGSYFHFITDNYNDCSGSRPMAYAPSIL